MRAKRGEAVAFMEAAWAQETDDCIIWPFRTNGRYPQVGYAYVHRIICTREHGPGWGDAAHSCGVPRCINKRHLSWKTRTQNMADCIQHGTRRAGERHPQAKLSNADIIQIRALAGVLSQSAIGRRFGVTQSYVCHLVNRQRRP